MRSLGILLKTFFTPHFRSPAKISFRKRLGLILLGILVFVSLVSFGPLLALHQTAFDSEYVASQVDEVDISSLAHDWLSEHLAPERPHLANAVEIGIIHLEPWIKDRLKPVVKHFHAFVLEEIEKGKLLDTIVAQRPLIEDVVANFDSVLELPILGPVLDALGITAESIEKYVNVSRVDAYLDVLEELAQGRQIIVIARNIYIPLIFFILLLIASIVFLSRELKAIIRRLGIIFAVSGGIQFLTIWPIKIYGEPFVLQYGITPLLEDFLQRMANDFVTVLVVFSSVLLVCGIVLIIVSVIYKPRQSLGTKALGSVESS
jgi:hypothetical protein